MNRARATAHAAAALFLAGLGLLFRVAPGPSGIYPPCAFRRITSWYCPGCGSSRALFALLHGRPAEAFHFNAFFVLLLPALLGYFAWAYARALRGRSAIWPRIPSPLLAALLFAAALFALFRNTSHPLL